MYRHPRLPAAPWTVKTVDKARKSRQASQSLMMQTAVWGGTIGFTMMMIGIAATLPR